MQPQGTASYRCCPPASYPDVVVMADKGTTSCQYNKANSGAFDYSLFDNPWQETVKELLFLPGGQYQQLRDYGSIDMADPGVLAAFLQRAYVR